MWTCSAYGNFRDASGDDLFFRSSRRGACGGVRFPSRNRFEWWFAVVTAVTENAFRIQLLGPVRAWHGDHELDLGTARRRAVFAILALSANHSVSQAELVDGLWGEQPSNKAIGTLHTYIYDLRRSLRPVRDTSAAVALTTHGSSYSLQVPADLIDEQRFLRHQESAQQRWDHGEFAAAAGELDGALAMWQGEALDGLAGPFAEL